MKVQAIPFLMMFFPALFLQAQRYESVLSGEDSVWKIWMDTEAQWENDTLFLPDQNVISKLRYNPPTCGWEKFYAEKGKACSLPTTVEEQFGTDNRWTYHGVSWYWREFDLPENWRDRKIFLDLGQFNHRVEVFVNNILVGYDAVALLPYRCDVTGALKYGGKNKLAVRVTSSGGSRGWEDYKEVKWGRNRILPTKDYSGIGGEVKLIAVPDTYIDDVFVKNLQPARANNIDVQTTVVNTGNQDVASRYSLSVIEKRTGKIYYENEFSCILQPGENILTRNLSVKDAHLWDCDHPEIYLCRIRLVNKSGTDEYLQDFGFRVFEIKEADGKYDFYLNGNRIRFRSAIDWGIYAFNGLFPEKDVAKRSIEAVKAVGHNSLNFHRRAGDIPLFENADTLGVYLYEEPGSFHSGGQGYNIEPDPFMRGQMYERLRRMVKRDRNHPSLLIYSLVNEDMVWSSAREMAMRLIHSMDNTRLILNSSGGSSGRVDEENKRGIHHIPPYGNEIQRNYLDFHTAFSTKQLMETDLVPKTETNHFSVADSAILYWGEVRCYAGTFNYPLLAKQGAHTGGYDYSMYLSQTEKLKDLYGRCSFGPAVRDLYDITRLAAKGQYYTDGRLGQVIMCNDHEDGYAVNGWSPGPDMKAEWSSAITDQNRNLNASGSEMAYWNRPLQVALIRQNGKYFNCNDTVHIKICIVNENKIPEGDYRLSIQIKDGAGKVRKTDGCPVRIKGGNVFAQTVQEDYVFIPDEEWRAGYVTVTGRLYKNDELVTDGAEQVLLRNRLSQKYRFKGKRIMLENWPAAETALRESGIKTCKVIPGIAGLILAGKRTTPEKLDLILEKVKAGSNLVLQTDSLMGVLLYEKGLLDKPITVWGGLQTPHWIGNGSSYIEDFVEGNAVPSGNVISTRSWEAVGDPKGFYPFSSAYPLHIHGLYVAHQFRRKQAFTDNNNVLVTYGEITYGKGKILLNSSYNVDEDNVFCDMLFYNMIGYYLR